MIQIKELIKETVNKLIPIECIGCGEIGEYLCQSCKTKLKSYNEICPICHKNSKGFKICQDCKINPRYENLKGIIIGFRYFGNLKKLLLKLKFYHKKNIAYFLAKRLVYNILSNDELGNIKKDKLLISFVSSHWYRHYFVKGYNQSELIANYVSEIMGCELIKICDKRKNTKSQTGLNRKERITNLVGAYYAINDLNINGKTIIIVDDIMTTGSTIIQIANKIKGVYNDCTIYGAVLAKN